MHDDPPRLLGIDNQLASFFAHEATGGILLIAASILALVLANSPAAALYARALHLPIGPLSLQHAVNDGLMALFFLVVGLEVKRELAEGALADPAARPLPLIAAGFGMAVPALIYVAVASGGDSGALRGWAVPAATDIAFAQAVLLIAGRGLPPSLRLFLTTVAIVDDIGAIVIIALAYTAALNLVMLAAAVAIVAMLWRVNRRGVRVLWPYLLLGALLWVAVYRSGVHATVSGVLTALFVPLQGQAGRAAPLHRLEEALHPWSAYAIVPLFGLANAGLSLKGIRPASLLQPIPLGIMLGLVMGKQLGVGLGTALALRLRLAVRPEGTTTAQLYGVALLAGIGFTMSLFIGGLAFSDPTRFDAVKLGVLAGSLISALAGFAVLRLSPRAPLSLDPSRS